ncbi:hypothetical protein H5410_027269 [Solanum commersonii]|uniref:Uncharacterized protein n=1 Tax=Solanum commersonii TaxID=4109 RepID=A0A9J5YYS2_SOLCO|nr:hypothetical protein H5410_027269 [Solanum commersonii]
MLLLSLFEKSSVVRALQNAWMPTCGFVQPQQAMVLQVPRDVAGAPIAPLLIEDQNVFSNHPNQLIGNTKIHD